jgi:hypothetical protein
MKSYSLIVVLCLFIFPLVSPNVLASEVCSQLGGTCRDACGQNEASEAGAFEDCTEAQKCCVAQEEGPRPLQCCIFSFNPKSYGTLNCGLPEQNACLKGSGSPVPCEKLKFCR